LDNRPIHGLAIFGTAFPLKKPPGEDVFLPNFDDELQVQPPEHRRPQLSTVDAPKKKVVYRICLLATKHTHLSEYILQAMSWAPLCCPTLDFLFLDVGWEYPRLKSLLLYPVVGVQ